MSKLDKKSDQIIDSQAIRQPMPELVATEGYLHSRIKQIFQPGLSLKQRIRSTPVIGYVFAWINALIRLPVMRHHTAIEISSLQAQSAQLQIASAQARDLGQRLSQAEELLTRRTAQLEAAVAQLEATVAQLEALRLSIRLEQYDALDIGKRLMQFDQLQIARKMKSIDLLMRTNQVHEDAVFSKIKKIELALNGLSPVSQALNVSSQSDLPIAVERSPGNPKDDNFYVEFEAVFRGERADIKRRLQVYLPYLSYILNQPVKNRLMVIDVGCGRGEWLELLDENNIPAMGVDMNAAMVDACLKQGLLARCADAIDLLREQAPGSIGAVTGFHIIEHLPFDRLLALYDAALHALAPGGVIIFETPNPENLKVGACNFYFDPTHMRPIVPQVAQFIATQRGFSEAEILRLHPYPDDHHLHGGSAVEAVINKEFFGPQDYALIGKK